MGLTRKYYKDSLQTKKQEEWLLENYDGFLQNMNELIQEAGMDWMLMKSIHDCVRRRIQFDKLSPFERVN